MVILFFIVAVLFGIPLGLVGLFVLMPIRVGATGSYREDARDVRGWARGFAGLLGVVFDYRETGGRVRVMLGRWVLWQPKPEEAESEIAIDGSEPVKPTPPAVREEGSPGQVQETPIVSESTRQAPRASSKAVNRSANEIPRVEPQTSKRPDSGGTNRDQAAPDKEKKPSLFERWRVLKTQLLRYRAYWHRARPILTRLLCRLWRAVRFRSVDLDVVFGAGDPSWTGRVFGYVEAVRSLLGPRMRLALTPDFVRARFEASGQMAFSVYLWRLLWALGCVAVRGGVVAFFIWRAERRVKRLAVAQEA